MCAGVVAAQRPRLQSHSRKSGSGDREGRRVAIMGRTEGHEVSSQVKPTAGGVHRVVSRSREQLEWRSRLVAQSEHKVARVCFGVIEPTVTRPKHVESEAAENVPSRRLHNHQNPALPSDLWVKVGRGSPLGHRVEQCQFGLLRNSVQDATHRLAVSGRRENRTVAGSEHELRRRWWWRCQLDPIDAVVLQLVREQLALVHRQLVSLNG